MREAAITGARLCEPQHGGNKGRAGVFEGSVSGELLRVTDPRSKKNARPVRGLTDRGVP
jgi:hypothetical protein